MRQFLLLITLLMLPSDVPKPDEGDLERIVGTWENLSRRFQGRDVEPFNDRLIVTRDMMSSESGAPGTTYGYELDLSADPKRITMWPMIKASDVVLPLGAPEPEQPAQDDSLVVAGEPVLGIYALDGDRLTICVRISDGERPQKFSAEKGDGNALQVYRKVEVEKE